MIQFSVLNPNPSRQPPPHPYMNNEYPYQINTIVRLSIQIDERLKELLSLFQSQDEEAYYIISSALTK